MQAPSGRQFEIKAGAQRAVVTEIGAGLRCYERDGRPVLDGYREDQMCRSGRGQVLMPWPNRIDGGAYEWDGAALQLPLTEAKAGNAIHGLVRWAAWAMVAQDEDRVVMRHWLRPQPGYPFELELQVEYALGDDGLAVRTTARNAGDVAAPFGAGAHPYLTLGTASIDELTLRLPTRTEPDFSAPRAIGSTRLDNCFGDLERDADGRARARLSDAAHATELWVGEGYRYLMVFTGDPLPDVNRRALAIEPMTCPPNAFRSGEGLIRLEPGQFVELEWGITPSG